MSFSFNLVDSPWIPCILQDGSAIELGLRETLARAHKLRTLGGESPLVIAALYRLLLAILHRVFGPNTMHIWADLWASGDGCWNTSALDAYFARWYERFDLFHATHPFYQMPDDRVKPVPITTMIPDISSGNNATLFDHTQDQDVTALTPVQAARMLVAAQNYSMGGKAAGTVEVSTSGPCVVGAIFLAQGENLFQTLALNLVRYPDRHRGGFYLIDNAQDRPAWEMDDPYSPLREHPFGYLDYLTWHNRRILLFPEETSEGLRVSKVTRGPGLRLNDLVTDPMKLYYQPKDPKKPIMPLRLNENKALWRDSASLFQLNAQGRQVPYVMRWLAQLVNEGILDRHQTVRYMALGMASNQAKVEFYRIERMPLRLEYLAQGGDELVDMLAKALELAENVGRALEDAGQWLAMLLIKPELEHQSLWEAQKDISSKTREEAGKLANVWGLGRRYWSRLEVPFRLLIEALPQETPQERQEQRALGQWIKRLRSTARNTLDEVTPNLEGGMRGLKATIKARDQLEMGLRYALGSDQKTQTDQGGNNG